MTLLLRKPLLLFSLLLLIVATGPGAAAEELIRNEWSLYIQEDRPIGYSHDQVWRTDLGYRYRAESFIKSNFLGTVYMVNRYIEMETDHNHLARSFLEVSDTNGSVTSIAGTFQPADGETTVELSVTDSAGNQRHTSAQVDSPVYFSSSFIDHIIKSQGLISQTEYAGTVWDFSTSSIAAFSLFVQGQTKIDVAGVKRLAFNAVQKLGASVMEVSIGPGGETYGARQEDQNLLILPTTKADIPELKAMNADALIVPGNLRVSHPFRSEKSRIRLAWRDLPKELFHWKDNRQRALEYISYPDRQEILIEIARDYQDYSGQARLPMTGADFTPYLCETRFINPNLPEIQAEVNILLEGESDAWSAARKIMSWVYETITSNMIPETLTTEEVLARKEGKCTEYAVLFAAMARAAGLPTRVALGERYENGVWIGHMWNEVWVGQWVAVDASHNQLAPDALLVKFVHSNDVMGTQAVRRGLIGQLEITIEDVEIPSGASEEKEMPQIQGATYRNYDFECEVSAPTGWTITRANDNGAETVSLRSFNREASAFLVLFNVPPGTEAEQILAGRMAGLRDALPGFTLLQQESRPLGKETAAYGGWQFVQDEVYQQENWIVIREDLGYLFVFITRANAWSEHEESFSAIRESFIPGTT